VGIGLSIVEKAVASYQGSIELSSEPGQGTRVTAMLPLDMD
jgi:signal transduction histidine kinase